MEFPQKSAAELRHEAAGLAYRQARASAERSRSKKNIEALRAAEAEDLAATAAFRAEWQAIEVAQRRAEREARAAKRAAIKAASDWSPARLAADAAERAELEARQFPRFNVPTWRIHL
jgi:hypothetical protein